jgi:preprotein translocase subunit YajC
VFISSAFAQGAPAPAPGFDMTMLMIIGMFVLMYFFMIRPQQKRAKEHRSMLDALQKGDEVVTAGGVAGRVTKLGEQYLTLEIAPNTEIVVQRSAVQVPLPKGTLKTLQ